MNNPLRSFADYELFLYSLTERFAVVRGSTVVLIRRGATLARVAGELHFDQDIRLVVRERLTCSSDGSVTIDAYGYEVWQGSEKRYWYDSQPHPNDPSLASTHPHHKHVPPNLKHNRIPANQMSFTKPNLVPLIQEIELLMKSICRLE
jgi:hypothetical protein